MLHNKNAVIYGAGGSLGSTIAKALARHGANIFLAGRHLPALETVRDEIVGSGGRAEACVVDALNEDEVGAFAGSVARKGGTLDLSYCAIDFQVVQNVPLVQMGVEDFVRPVAIAMRSHFLTATAAGKIMMEQRSGVILSVTATPGGIGYPYTAGFAPCLRCHRVVFAKSGVGTGDVWRAGGEHPVGGFSGFAGVSRGDRTVPGRDGTDCSRHGERHDVEKTAVHGRHREHGRIPGVGSRKEHHGCDDRCHRGNHGGTELSCWPGG